VLDPGDNPAGLLLQTQQRRAPVHPSPEVLEAALQQAHGLALLQAQRVGEGSPLGRGVPGEADHPERVAVVVDAHPAHDRSHGDGLGADADPVQQLQGPDVHDGGA